MVTALLEMRKTRDARRAVVRKEIIRRAAALIGERGYRAVTVDAIAEDAGISKPAFYAYLESKEKILFEIYEVIRTTSLKLAKASPAEKLHTLIRGHIADLVDKREFYAVFFRDEVELPTRLKNKHRAAHDEYRRAVEEILRQCMREGAFPKVEPRVATLGLLGMCNWVARWYQPGGELTPDAIADTFYALLVGSSPSMSVAADQGRAAT